MQKIGGESAAEEGRGRGGRLSTEKFNCTEGRTATEAVSLLLPEKGRRIGLHARLGWLWRPFKTKKIEDTTLHSLVKYILFLFLYFFVQWFFWGGGVVGKGGKGKQKKTFG